MEFHNPFFNSTFICSFLFLFVLLKIVKKWSCNNSSINLPPGPWTLPIIGNIHQVISNSLLHQCFRNLAEKYGPLMYLKLGEVSYIIVSSPSMAKEIMKTHDLNFCDRPNLLLSSFGYNATDIAFSPYGEHWRQLRKICTLQLLSAKHVQSFRYIREQEVSNLIKSISTSEGSVVNLSHKIFSMTSAITTRAAFGKRNKHQQVFQSAIKEIASLMGGFCIADVYPSIKMLQRVSGAKTKFGKFHKEIDMILQDIVDDHKNIHKEESKDEDLVDALIKIQQENDLSHDHTLTDDSMKSIILDMFVGGTETSSGVVLWGISEMIKNPKIMKEAQAEVRKVFDKKGHVDETELHHLIYLKSIIKETLRLHPSLPLLIPRESRERCQINGYEIPAKTRVAINVWAIGRDERYWAEAESFKPERFLNSTIDFKGTNFEYIPFGAGRRMCPGMAFGLSNIELPLAQLLYHFDWKLPNGMKNEELDMTESFGLAVVRKHDLCLIPITRRL